MLKKYPLFLFIPLMVLAACASYHATPPPDLYPETRRIVIVAVETEPSEPLRASGWTVIGASLAPGGGTDLFLLSEAASLLAEELENQESALEPRAPRRHSGETWSPALTLAREAAMLIASASGCEVLVRKEQFRLPASVQGPPLSALQNWYRQKASALKPQELEVIGRSSVLEIGLSDFSLTQDQLLIQILTKRIDPMSGEVRARSKVHESVTVRSPEELFRHGGETFKAVFAAAGKRLLETNLREIGLLPPPSTQTQGIRP